MPCVQRNGEKYFNDYFKQFNEPQIELLSTIRVPKNLLYLTDKLPKPHYDTVDHKRNRKDEVDDLRRKTQDHSLKQPADTKKMIKLQQE